jgi:hypothetical protein
MSEKISGDSSHVETVESKEMEMVVAMTVLKQAAQAAGRHVEVVEVGICVIFM